MRKWINLMERAEDKEPVVSGMARPGDKVVELFMLYVPHHLRGMGAGRAAYEEWEAKLPRSVERVEIDAVDYGDGAGDAKPFWDRLGFDFKYSGDNLDAEEQNRMWKGVNGHPTPPSIGDDDEYA
jgi:hypothetical protein